jgi:two-component system chemotaxis response regulator CheY
MRALIVEDNPTNQKLLIKMLAPLGDCSTADDGREGVEAFQAALAEKKPYDLICLDVMMPHMDGHETLIEIRRIERENKIQHDQGAKVIMITAVQSPSSIKEAQSSGSNGYLLKPIRKITLFEELERLGLLPQTL